MADSDYQSRFARLRQIPASATLILVVVVSVAMMVVDTGDDYLQPVRSALSVVAYPFQVAALLPSKTVGYLESYVDRGALIETNERLEQKNLQLQVRLQKLASLKNRNKRLRSLLGSAGSIDRHVQIARILSSNPDPYRHRIKLNKGGDDGAFVGQALIDANGIVGQVVRVGLASSHAILITDPSHGIPVEINRNGLETIARGTGRTGTLELPFLAKNADVHEGDLLVSSGLAGRYPAGYPVARVATVSHATGREFLNVTAKPTASLGRGRAVLLIWNRNTAPDHEADPAADGNEAGDS